MYMHIHVTIIEEIKEKIINLGERHRGDWRGEKKK